MNDAERREWYKRELVIAIKIYEQTVVKNKQVWFTKLVEMLKMDMDRSQVSRTIDHMFDCGMLHGDWEIENGGKGWVRCLTLANPYKDYFAEMYEDLNLSEDAVL